MLIKFPYGKEVFSYDAHCYIMNCFMSRLKAWFLHLSFCAGQKTGAKASREISSNTGLHILFV